MKTFSDFIKESVVDIPRANLDPTVFEFPDNDGEPFLRHPIKRQILRDMDDFIDIVPIKRFYIVGSILTKFYGENSDIDVNIDIYKDDVDDLMQAKLIEIIRRLNGKLAANTTHPINYYIVLGDVNESDFDGMYDVQTDKWIKIPENVETNISEYLHNFNKIIAKVDLTIAQINRDIIDYDTLSQFDDKEIRDIHTILSHKLYEISDKVETLVDIKNTINRQRKKAFKRPMTPDEIQKYKDKNHLPENIIEKLLQKYYYWDFIKKLEKIITGKESLTSDDIEDIKAISKDNCVQTFESFVQQKEVNQVINELRNFKIKKVDWKSPDSHNKSFLQKFNRSTNRKSLMQVPNVHRVDRRMLMSSNLGSAKKVIDIAKKSPSGIWRVTPQQVNWIANKYHFIPPNTKKNLKHLGNTGIIVWRKAKNVYYVVKDGVHY